MILQQSAEDTKRADRAGWFGGDFTVQEANDRAQSPSSSFVYESEDDWSNYQEDGPPDESSP